MFLLSPHLYWADFTAHLFSYQVEVSKPKCEQPWTAEKRRLQLDADYGSLVQLIRHDIYSVPFPQAQIVSHWIKDARKTKGANDKTTSTASSLCAEHPLTQALGVAGRKLNM